MPWPDPPGGFKLRNYKPFDYDKPDTNMRLFRSTNLMVNVMLPRPVLARLTCDADLRVAGTGGGHGHPVQSTRSSWTSA